VRRGWATGASPCGHRFVIRSALAMRPFVSRIVGMCVGMCLVCLGLAGGCGAAVPMAKYPIPTPSSAPQGITSGPDGNLWFTEIFGNKIGRITRGARKFVAADRPELPSARDASRGHEAPFPRRGGYEIKLWDKKRMAGKSGRGGTRLGKVGRPFRGPNQGVAHPIA